ncbi:Glycosyl transferase family 2 [Alloiococcus otitis]|uniref:Glycosyltransferase 2-like domain-containing protein n=1 Tax=Alloiococcus otitis ATCC 51267 TaxID=883081 RepID=K9E759_9LACT|nr:glycosyltransferase family A protein [Alloiococcus otitis]EKU92999.1 hypothetical protein HMPREF9698_01305 [Alloiococcus otitis ATCC 51267]SUU80861.1 Glycosyl transferase family 2 [Alloiococcus otitis]
MDLEVLLSTMNKNNLDFLNNINLSSNCVIVNQNKDNYSVKDVQYGSCNLRLVNSKDIGLSRSRNLAIKNSRADICVIADDDIVYKKNYVNIIKQAYMDNPHADIIAFQVSRINSKDRKKSFRKRKSWDGYLTSMKISSVEITFKRKSIVNNGISFNTDFGAGTYFSHGEENIFLYDCLDHGLKILYLPIEVGQVDVSNSSWFQGYNASYFHTLGAKFYNMSQITYPVLIFQFAIRKYKLYKEELSFFQAIYLMKQGVDIYKKKMGIR